MEESEEMNMARKIIVEKDKLFECPACGYRWMDEVDLSFNEDECVPCCPDCGELIEDGENGGEYI